MNIELDKIYCGDSYELIKSVPDKSVDLVVIDPPYEFQMGGDGHSPVAQRMAKARDEIVNLDTELTKKSIVTGGGCFVPKQRNYYSEFSETNVSKEKNSARFISNGITNEILDELVRVMKKGNIYIFCNKNQLRQYFDYFGDLGWNLDLLVWNKTNCIPTVNNTYLANLEYCFFARESGTPLYGSYETKSKCYTSPCNKADKDLYEHPTIKPLQFIKNLIINSSQEGGVVLDCFLGSGTTAVACKELNRHFIGFELNPRFVEIANDRLKGVTKQDRENKEKGYIKLFE